MTTEEKKTTTKERTFFGGVRSMLLASIGALALGSDEIEAVVNKLVDRGELAEQEGRKLLRDVLDQRKKEMETSTDRITGVLEDQLEGLSHRMNLPTRADIKALNTQVAQLTLRIEALRQAQEQQKEESKTSDSA